MRVKSGANIVVEWVGYENGLNPQVVTQVYIAAHVSSNSSSGNNNNNNKNCGLAGHSRGGAFDRKPKLSRVTATRTAPPKTKNQPFKSQWLS
jgi:hypothetical protein